MRIRVERVIGYVRRKYSILRGIFLVASLTTRQEDDLAPIAKIAMICCALTNLNQTNVPFD